MLRILQNNLLASISHYRTKARVSEQHKSESTCQCIFRFMLFRYSSFCPFYCICQQSHVRYLFIGWTLLYYSILMSSQIIFDCIYAYGISYFHMGSLFLLFKLLNGINYFENLNSLFFLYQTMNLVLKHHSFFCDQFIFLINVYYCSFNNNNLSNSCYCQLQWLTVIGYVHLALGP